VPPGTPVCCAETGLHEYPVGHERRRYFQSGYERRRALRFRARKGRSFYRMDEEEQEEILAAEWRAVEDEKRDPEEALRQRVEEAFQAQKERTLSAIDSVMEANDPERGTEGTPPGQRAEPALTAESVFDFGEALADMQEALTSDAVLDAIRIGFETGALRIDDEELQAGVSRDTEWVRAILEELNQQANGITEVTRRRINAIAADVATDSEQEIEDARRRISEEFEWMSEVRSRRIAATSVQTAFETGQDEAWSQADLYGSAWLSMRDSRVRSGHREADTQKRQLGTPFDVAPRRDRPTEELSFPGDPEGSAGNIIHCRCTRRPFKTQEAFEEAPEIDPFDEGRHRHERDAQRQHDLCNRDPTLAT